MVFFFLPEKLGRKGTMNVILPLFIISSYLSIFPKTLDVRAFGLFLLGMFHLNVSTCYTHILELVEEQYKQICTTIIIGFDSATLLIACSTYLFYKPDE